MPFFPFQLFEIYFAKYDEQHEEEHVLCDESDVLQRFVHKISCDVGNVSYERMKYDAYHHGDE